MKLLILIPLVLLGETTAPSISQAVLEAILVVIAGGVWKLVTQINVLLGTVRGLKRKEGIIDHRLDDHGSRLHAVDGKNEAPYYS